jgi:hypothetical protein
MTGEDIGDALGLPTGSCVAIVPVKVLTTEAREILGRLSAGRPHLKMRDVPECEDKQRLREVLRALGGQVSF